MKKTNRFLPILFATTLGTSLLAAPDSSTPPPPLVKLRDTVSLVLPRNPSNRPPPVAIRQQVETFFSTLQKNDVDGAFKGLFADAEELRRKYNTDDFIERTKSASLMYGPISGFELYDNHPIGSRIIYLTYFVYYKAVPLRWRLVYYSADGIGYKLINLSVDDLLDQSILTE